MGLLTVGIAFIHALVTLLNFRSGFLLFIFFYATYPRLFGLGIGSEGFALTGQRIMLFFTIFLFFLKMLFGSKDTRRAWRIMREEWIIPLLFTGLIAGRLMGNITTGRVDVTVLTGCIDELFSTFVIVLLTYCCIAEKRDIYRVLMVIAMSIFFNELVTIYEFISQGSIFPTSLQLAFETSNPENRLTQGGTRYGMYRVMGVFDNSLKLMAIFCITLPMVLFMARNTVERNQRVILIITLIMIPVVLFWTGSRTGLALLLMVALVYLYSYVTTRLSRIEGTFVLLVTALMLFVVAYFTVEPLIRSFIFGGEGGKSSMNRIIQYILSWNLLLESPWFGYGFARNIVDVIEIKSMDGYYLRTVMEGGVVALSSLIAVFVVTFSNLNKVKRLAANQLDRELAFTLQISMLVIITMMLAINMGTSSFYGYLIVGLAVLLKRFTLGTAKQRRAAKRSYRQIAASQTT